MDHDHHHKGRSVWGWIIGPGWWWLPLRLKGSRGNAMGTALVIIGGYLSFVGVFLYSYRIGWILNYRKATFPRVRRARKVTERPSPRELPVSAPIPTYLLSSWFTRTSEEEEKSFFQAISTQSYTLISPYRYRSSSTYLWYANRKSGSNSFSIN